jgi:hypothetical protein
MGNLVHSSNKRIKNKTVNKDIVGFFTNFFLLVLCKHVITRLKFQDEKTIFSSKKYKSYKKLSKMKID